MRIPNGTPVKAFGFDAVVVDLRPELGGYVVAMTGADGTAPGEQFVIAEDEIA